MKIVSILVVFCSLLYSLQSYGDISPKEWRQFNQGVSEQYVKPRYQLLASRSSILAKSTRQFCDKPDDVSLAESKAAFHAAMDAWQDIQHIHFGPIETMMRNFSLQYWPDKKNHIGKQLNVLMSEANPATLNTAAFYQLSVSVKGLPAVERLLFDDQALADLKNSAYRCQVLNRIAAYIEEMSTGIYGEWQSDMSGAFDSPGEDEFFEDDIEAATAFIKSLVEPVEVIRDLKVNRVIDKKKINIKRLESWRSLRSLRNIERNLATLQSLYLGSYLQKAGTDQSKYRSLSSLMDKVHNDNIIANFAAVNKQLEAINVPVEVSLRSKEGIQSMRQLSDLLTELHESMTKAMTVTGINLGFNSRDGD